MDELFCELKQFGVTIESLLERCNHQESNVRKYLQLYLKDPSFQRIIVSLEHMDMHEFALAVHALKGAAGNIGMVPVYEIAYQMDQYIKGEREDAAIRMVPELKTRYQESVEIIQKYLG